MASSHGKLSIRGLQNVRFLNLGHNNISTLLGLSTCTELRALLLNDNLFKTWPPTTSSPSAATPAFPLPPNLGTLILSNNRLISFSLRNSTPSSGQSASPLHQLLNTQGHAPTKLIKLSLSHNQLISWPDIPEPGAPELEELRLAYNALTEVPTAAAALLPKLRILDLGHNRIADFDAVAALGGCTVLENLNLAGNPACEAAGFRDQLLRLLPRLKLLDGRKVHGGTGSAWDISGPDRHRIRTPDPRECFVSNLPFDVNADDLALFFSPLGPGGAVSKVQLLHARRRRDDDAAAGRSKGAAFVKFRTDEAARRAVAEFANQSIPYRRHGAAGGGGGGGELAHRRVRVVPSWRDRHGKPCRPADLQAAAAAAAAEAAGAGAFAAVAPSGPASVKATPAPAAYRTGEKAAAAAAASEHVGEEEFVRRFRAQQDMLGPIEPTTADANDGGGTNGGGGGGGGGSKGGGDSSGTERLIKAELKKVKQRLKEGRQEGEASYSVDAGSRGGGRGDDGGGSESLGHGGDVGSRGGRGDGGGGSESLGGESESVSAGSLDWDSDRMGLVGVEKEPRPAAKKKVSKRTGPSSSHRRPTANAPQPREGSAPRQPPPPVLAKERRKRAAPDHRPTGRPGGSAAAGGRSDKRRKVSRGKGDDGRGDGGEGRDASGGRVDVMSGNTVWGDPLQYTMG